MIVNEGLQVSLCINDRPIAGHDVADANAAQTFDCFELSISRTSSIQEKPANECQPQTGEARTVEEAEESDNNKCKRYELTDRGGEARGSRSAASDPPNDCPQHSPAIERESGNHIEDCQRDIDNAQPA